MSNLSHLRGILIDSENDGETASPETSLFTGLVGVVRETGRRAVIIDVMVGDKVKTVISRKEHITPLPEAKK